MNIDFASTASPMIAKLFGYALQFYATKLMIDSFRPITIKYVTLDDMFINEDGSTAFGDSSKDRVHGAVFFEGKTYDTAKLDVFKLGIWWSLPPGEMFQIMAHEMIHIEQYASHRLRTIQNDNGVFNRWDLKMISNETPYEELPWEIDAYARQDKLFLDLSKDEGFMLLCENVAKEVSN